MNSLWCTEEEAAGSADLIYEEHNIPIYFEEEVVAEETVSVSEPKFQKSSNNRDPNKTNQSYKSGSHTPTSANANFKPFVLNEHTMKIFKNKIKAIQKRRAQALAREKKQRPKKLKPMIQQQPPLSVNVSKPPTQSPAIVKPSLNTNFHYKSRPSMVDPTKSGEILRMEKVDTDDIEIDILSNSEDDELEKIPCISTFPEVGDDEENGSSDEQTDELMAGIMEIKEQEEEEETTSFSSLDEPDGAVFVDSIIEEDIKFKIEDLKETDECTMLMLESNDSPTQELVLDETSILPVERFMLSEFFTGSLTKNPERYLKIRNHIIGMWQAQKPLYLSKTAARHGLKKCGDVNTIGRVHLTLENLGAINYGCTEVKWILPLKILYGILQQSIRNKSQRTNSFSADDPTATSMISSDSMVKRIKSRTQSRTQFELIKCQRYSKDNSAPFEISITLSCLLCLYFHALSSKLEIMGFLGGSIEKNNGRNKINLQCYRPCRTTTSTSISAEMCPVSQVEQSTNITNAGFELLGWFHSHPTFPATPSRTDLKTQNEIQMQFAPNNPFIGFILSCLQMDFK